jgi:hypothetical protein
MCVCMYVCAYVCDCDCVVQAILVCQYLVHVQSCACIMRMYCMCLYVLVCVCVCVCDNCSVCLVIHALQLVHKTLIRGGKSEMERIQHFVYVYVCIHRDVYRVCITHTHTQNELASQRWYVFNILCIYIYIYIYIYI